jgi:putative transposase
MPIYHRQFNPGELQFITTSTYHRAPLFCSETLAGNFADTLARLRQEMGFGLQGWVLMPDHFHLLIRPIPADATSLIVKQLKQQTAHQALVQLKKHLTNEWSAKMLARIRLSTPQKPGTAHHRLWQRRFYVFNVCTENKYYEKLEYMHSNPTKAGLISNTTDWRWSSARYHAGLDNFQIPMDRFD